MKFNESCLIENALYYEDLNLRKIKKIQQQNSFMKTPTYLRFSFCILAFASMIILSQATPTFVDSNQIYTKGGYLYYPNVGMIPDGTTITKIGISLGGQIDRLAVYLTTPSNATLVYDAFGSSTRAINTYYEIPSDNVIHTLRFGTYVCQNGQKCFIAVQFIGTTHSSPYYIGSFSSKIAKVEYIYLDYPMIAFFGHVETQTRSICGIGVVMIKKTSQDQDQDLQKQLHKKTGLALQIEEKQQSLNKIEEMK